MPPDGSDFTGRMATVTGWGRLKYGGGVPSVLQEVQVNQPLNMNSKKCQLLIVIIFLCSNFRCQSLKTMYVKRCSIKVDTRRKYCHHSYVRDMPMDKKTVVKYVNNISGVYPLNSSVVEFMVDYF